MLQAASEMRQAMDRSSPALEPAPAGSTSSSAPPWFAGRTIERGWTAEDPRES